MIALLQRVRWARVQVDGEVIAAIDRGLLVFVGIEQEDTPAQADRLVERVAGYRVFGDAQGRMNRSLQDIDGGLLLVSQFTLAADTRKGMRPSFTPAASPAEGARLYDHLVQRAAALCGRVQSGRFGAAMEVSLLNDGPVTFLLHVPPSGRAGNDG